MTQIKETINAIMDETLKEVQLNFPSIYSKEDVQHILINLSQKLNKIDVEESTEVGLTPDDVIACMNDDMDITEYAEADLGTAEFSMSGNYVELDEVEIDWNSGRFFRDLKSNLENYLVTKKEGLNKNN